MSKRMTAAEVVAELRRMARDAHFSALRDSDLQARDTLYAVSLQLPRLVDLVERYLFEHATSETDIREIEQVPPGPFAEETTK